MVSLEEIIAGYIESKEGSSVSTQFTDTFEGSEGFDEQNNNALKLILKRCEDLSKSEILNDESGELSEYIDNLTDYLKK